MFTRDTELLVTVDVHTTLSHNCDVGKLPQSNRHCEQLLVLMCLQTAVLLLMWIGTNHSPRALHDEKLYWLRLNDWVPIVWYYNSIVTELLIFVLLDEKKTAISSSDGSSCSYLS